MKKQLTRLFQNFSSARKGRQESLRRHLRMEGLEDRKLMASDTAPHNVLIAEDVNRDFLVTPLDALLVITHLQRVRSVGLGEGESGGTIYSDVSGDGKVSPLDALLVIDALRGEGADDKIIEYSVRFVDSNGNAITQVAVGQSFTAQIFAKDLRQLPQRINLPDFDASPTGNFPGPEDTDRNGNGILDPGPTDDFATGVMGAGVDLDLSGGNVSANNLVQFVPRTTGAFVNGFTFGPRLNDFPFGFRSAIIAFSATTGAELSDGASVTVVDSSNTTRVFEFDSDGAVTSGRTAVTFTAANTRSELAQALVSAINAAQGFVAKAQLDATGTRISFTGTSQATPPTAVGNGIIIDPEFNEMSASEIDLNNLSYLLDRDPPIDPTRFELLLSANFKALATGTFTITPNASEDGSNAPTLINFYQATSPTVTVPEARTNVAPGSFLSFLPSSLTIIADPTSPVAANDTISTAEDTAIIVAGASSTLNPSLIANDTVTSPRTISVTSIAAIAGTTLGTVNASTFTYTPPAEFNGTDRFTYTITDSTGLTAVGTVTVNVTPVNDPPTAVADAFNVTGDTVDNPLNVLANDSRGPANEASQTLTITAVGATNNGGVVTRTNNNTSLLYTPAAGFDGTETFTYTISDGGATTSTATVTITVDPATRPLARRDTATMSEVSAGGSGSVTINVLSNDAVNPGANVRAILLPGFTQPANGTVTLADNGTPADQSDDRLVYTPNFEFNGTDTFTYIMNDTAAIGANSVGTVTVTVTDVNDPPILVNDSPAQAGVENTPYTIAISTLLSNDSPGLGETTTQTLTLRNPASTNGTVAISGSNVVFTPATSRNGALTFTYEAIDNGSPALFATATVTVNFTAVNDAPVPVNDQRSTNEDVVLVFAASTLTTNDAPGPATATDEATQTLTVTAVSATGSAGGTVSLAGGNVTYTPDKDFNGTETFTYTVQDSLGATAVGTVTVTVNAVNDAPVATDDTASGFKGVAIEIPVANLLINDNAGPANERGSQTLSITSVQNAVNGTVSLNAALGIITFTPNSDFTGDASFEYTVTDSGPSGGLNVNTDVGRVAITIQPFVPTDVAGTVWVDETNDGVIDAAERRLGGVKVTLTGEALGAPITPVTVMTLADGSYNFENLAPGRYVVTLDKPNYLMDGKDVPGKAGDSDSVANQFTVEIAQPGGIDASGYNFALQGLDFDYGRIMDLLASRYIRTNQSLQHTGAMIAIGADNSLKWFSHFDGFDGIKFGEAVINDAGDRLHLTVVDSQLRVYTATLTNNQFVVANEGNGNKLIRVLGDFNSLNFQQINRSAPPSITTRGYLDAVDDIFAQEDWDSII